MPRLYSCHHTVDRGRNQCDLSTPADSPVSAGPRSIPNIIIFITTVALNKIQQRDIYRVAQ